MCPDRPFWRALGRRAQVRYEGLPIPFKLNAFVSYCRSDPITLARIAIRYSGVPPTTPQKRHLHTLDSSVHECHAPISQLPQTWLRNQKRFAPTSMGALAAALSAVGSFQRQISFAAPF